VPHEQLLQEYRRASVYVHAAAEESSPVAVAQAMAAGLPLCAVEIPGLGHLLEPGRTGVWAREPAPSALALAIATVLGDPEMARALGENGRRAALARFHPAAVAGATGELYREILAAAGR